MTRMSRAQITNELRRLRRARYESYLRDGWNWVRWIALENDECTDRCREMNGRILAINDPSWPQLLRMHTSCGCRFIMLLDREVERLGLN